MKKQTKNTQYGFERLPKVEVQTKKDEKKDKKLQIQTWNTRVDVKSQVGQES